MADRVKFFSKETGIKKEGRIVHRQPTGFSRPPVSIINQILFLQRTLGNQAIQGLFTTGTIQPKLKIGQPNGINEQEADRVTKQVMSMHEPQVQRQPFEEEEETVQTQKISSKYPSVKQDIETRVQSSRTGGTPLSESTRSFFEPRFGHDFSLVRIHTGPEAIKMNRTLNAQALTYEKNIYFGEGLYNPGTLSSKKLLAHELAHVVQQKNYHTSYFKDNTVPLHRVEHVLFNGQSIPTISEKLPSSTVAGRFYLTKVAQSEIIPTEVVWAIDYDQRQEKIVAWIDVIRTRGGEVSEITAQQRERIGRETTLPASDIEVRMGLPPGTLTAEEHNPVEGAVYFGILNPEDNIPLLRRQIGAIEAREIGQFRAPGEGLPPGPVTNNPDALVTASLEMLFQLYAIQQPRYRLMPARIVFSRDWVMSDTGTARLRGTIRWKLANRLGQFDQRQHLLSYVDDIVRGSEHRKDELLDIINEAFDRVAELGLTAAQRTAPALVDVGRQGRTWTRRRAELEHLTMHAAMDVPGPEGTGIYAPLEGRVVYTGQSSTYGNLVRILHESPPPTTAAEDARGRSIVWRGPVVTSYAHLLTSPLVSTGDQVSAGQAVGIMGATGISGMGVHLHFSVMRASGGRVTPLTSRTEESPILRIRPDTWLQQIGRVSVFATYYPPPTRRRRR